MIQRRRLDVTPSFIFSAGINKRRHREKVRSIPHLESLLRTLALPEDISRYKFARDMCEGKPRWSNRCSREDHIMLCYPVTMASRDYAS